MRGDLSEAHGCMIGAAENVVCAAAARRRSSVGSTRGRHEYQPRLHLPRRRGLARWLIENLAVSSRVPTDGANQKRFMACSQRGSTEGSEKDNGTYPGAE